MVQLTTGVDLEILKSMIMKLVPEALETSNLVMFGSKMRTLRTYLDSYEKKVFGTLKPVFCQRCVGKR